MNDGKASFNVLESIEKHIEALKPLLPKQAIVCIGEYPIKMFLKDPGFNNQVILPIFIDKFSDEIYKWLPKGYSENLIIGFEEANIDTHFWYQVMPTIRKDNSVIRSIQRKSTERLPVATIFASIWDGIGSAALPTFIGKFYASHIDSLSIAVLPSKVQPIDAQFNAYAAMKICSATEGATVLLIGRDQVENYVGVDRKGELIKGNMVINYLLNLFLAKDSLVEEISELSRTFGTKMFTPIVATGASYKVYGSIENMLNAALLKSFFEFDLSTSSLLYVLLRMPLSLKDTISKGKIELAITNWFKKKTTLQSIYVSEPVYTNDMTDRIDAVLFVGGFEIGKILSDLEQKVLPLKNLAIEKGFMTNDGSFVIKAEEKPSVVDSSMKEQSREVLESTAASNIESVTDKVTEKDESQIKQNLSGEISQIELPILSEPTKVEETQMLNETQNAKGHDPLSEGEIAKLQIGERPSSDLERAMEPKLSEDSLPLQTEKEEPLPIDKDAVKESEKPSRFRRFRRSRKSATK